MFAAGIIIFLIGCVLRIWLNLNEHSTTRAMSPQPVNERNVTIKMLHRKTRMASIDSTAMMIIGAILILIYGVFN